MKINDDLETVSILCAEILQVLRVRGARTSSEVSLYSHLDPKRVRKYLRLLARKGLIESFEFDNQKRYTVTSNGSTFAENLIALMSERKL
jgi:predicted transcriptional regulator